MRAEAAYRELIERLREQALLSSCAGLLSWDEETHMPRAGAAQRAEQLALLAGLDHARGTDPRIGELLAELEGSPLVRDPLSPPAVNVRELRRSYDRATRLPRGLVEELARTVSLAHQEWEAARRQSDFKRFRPWLGKVFTLKRREAECLGFEETAYDALLEEYEPGARSRALTDLFDALRTELIPLANEITHSGRQGDASILHRHFPIEPQRRFTELLASGIGFDFARGHSGESAHPFFCTVGPHDTRITTRYSPYSFSDGAFGILHEAGHGLYEQGLPVEHYGTPMAEAPSLGLHESQARLWENFVGRGRAFWRHFFPLARRLFHESLGDVSLDEFHRAINHVEPTPIRVGADEVTYNLHVLIRFEVERALLEGDLAVADLPAAWNEKYRHQLGVTPRDDAEGCLQDSHWAAGMVGYFPSYTLGNLLAAQLWGRARKDVLDMEDDFAGGDYRGLLGWLRSRVHSHGSRYSASRLMEEATGSPPGHEPLLRYLREKYAEIARI